MKLKELNKPTADIASHEKVIKQLLDKKKREQSTYHKKIDALE